MLAPVIVINNPIVSGNPSGLPSSDHEYHTFWAIRKSINRNNNNFISTGNFGTGK